MEKLIKARETLILALIKANEKYHLNDDSINKIIVDPIVKDADNFYLSSSEELGKVTYARNKSDKFNERKRVKTSFRRFLRRQLGINHHQYSDDWLDRFGCEVLSFLPFDINARIKVLNGDDILAFYCKTFVSTCMTGKANKEKIAFYATNKDKVNLAVMDNYMRAFIWNTDEDIKVLDRIYPSGNLDAEALFRKWATDKGYKLRLNPSGAINVSEKIGIENNLVLHVTAKKCELYPYFDTFRFGKFENNNVILCNFPENAEVVFTRANGGYNNFVICNICKKICVNNVRKVNGAIICDECAVAHYYRCGRCGGFVNKSTLSSSQKYQINYYGYVYCDYCREL